jgi:hypothetical protein
MRRSCSIKRLIRVESKLLISIYRAQLLQANFILYTMAPFWASLTTISSYHLLAWGSLLGMELYQVFFAPLNNGFVCVVLVTKYFTIVFPDDKTLLSLPSPTTIY